MSMLRSLFDFACSGEEEEGEEAAAVYCSIVLKICAKQ